MANHGIRVSVGAGVAAFVLVAVGRSQGGPLDPWGSSHVPIGVADTLDTLKTFVEAEGDFSPGFGSYGIYFWVYNRETRKLTAPTMADVRCDRGLSGSGYLIPWTRWSAGKLAVKTDVCEVRRESPVGELFVVGARAHLTNRGKKECNVSLYVALRPVGAAGWAVNNVALSEHGYALLVEGQAAIVSKQKPCDAGVSASDDVGKFAFAGKLPAKKTAASRTGDCSGALRFDLDVAAGHTKTLDFVCPVLPGRRAVGHRWDGRSTWAQPDDAVPNPARGGTMQPPGPQLLPKSRRRHFI